MEITIKKGERLQLKEVVNQDFNDFNVFYLEHYENHYLLFAWSKDDNPPSSDNDYFFLRSWNGLKIDKERWDKAWIKNHNDVDLTFKTWGHV